MPASSSKATIATIAQRARCSSARKGGRSAASAPLPDAGRQSEQARADREAALGGGGLVDEEADAAADDGEMDHAALRAGAARR